MRIHWSLVRKILLVIIILVFLFQAASFWALTIDDAYISGRYARNTASGKGLVFNPGERIMGYTNLLLVLFEAMIYKFGGDGIFFAKVVGLLSGFMILLLTYFLGRQFGGASPQGVGLLASALLVSSPLLALNSVMGLETCLFTALILGAILLIMPGWLNESWTWKRHVSIAFLLFLATLTRPEGLGFAGIFILVQFIPRLFRMIKTRYVNLKTALLSLSWLYIYGFLLLPVLVLLTAYYGSPIPNTFLAKTAAGLAWQKYFAGVLYLAQWISQSGGEYWLIPLILLPFLIAKEKKAVQAIGILCFLYLLYVIYSGGDWMPGYRFIMPVIPMVYLLSSNAIVNLWQLIQPKLTQLTTLSQGILASILFIAFISPSLSLFQSIQTTVNSRSTGYQEAHLYIAEWLRDNSPPGSSVALMDIGLIGLVSDRYVIDITGLVNNDIANLMHQDQGMISSSKPTADKIASLVLSKQPDFIVLAHNTPQLDPFMGWSHDEAIYASTDFHSQYQLVFTRKHMDDYYLSLFQHKK